MTRHPLAAWLVRMVVGLGFSTITCGAWAADTRDPVIIGERFQLQSKILNETRTYVVHTPSYSSRHESYPLLILQDGENNFMHTSAAVDLLSATGRIPPMIVVGIYNTDRARDMTPTKPEKAVDGTPWTGSGAGAKNFLSFIADELIPTIEHKYRTRPYRVLVGHSLGGLFAIYALTTRPDVFNAYLAISPSLWWDDQSLVKAAQPFFAAHPDLRGDLYMTMANEGQAMLGGAWKLSAILEESKLPNLRWHFKRSPEEDHGSTPYLSTYEGLQVIFDGYRIADPVALFDQGGIDAIERHYAEVSKRLGYEVKITTDVYANTAYTLADHERLADAETVGKYWIAKEPKSSIAVMTMAQFAARRKDDAQATQFLTQVLQMFPGNTGARQMLALYHVDADKIAPSLPISARNAAAFAGQYGRDADLKTITYESGKLLMKSALGDCELHALTATKLYCVDWDIEFAFRKNSGGRVVGVTVDDEYEDDGAYLQKVK